MKQMMFAIVALAVSGCSEDRSRLAGDNPLKDAEAARGQTEAPPPPTDPADAPINGLTSGEPVPTKIPTN
jgi:hypothetical protein